MTIDQLTYFSSDPASTETIQHVGKTPIPYKDVGVGLIKDSGLLGTSSIPPPNVSPSVATIHMISSDTVMFDDPWIIPSESEIDSFDGVMPLSPFEIAYQVVQSLSNPSSTKIDPMNGIQEESRSISSSATTTFP